MAIIEILSLGLYSIHWFKNLQEYIESRNGYVPNALGYSLMFFLIPISIIADLYLQAKYVKQADTIGPYFDYELLVLLVIASIFYIIWAKNASQNLDQATAGSVVSKFIFLPFGLNFISLAVLQSAINNLNLDIGLDTQEEQHDIARSNDEVLSTTNDQTNLNNLALNTPIAGSGSSWQQNLLTNGSTVAEPHTYSVDTNNVSTVIANPVPPSSSTVANQVPAADQVPSINQNVNHPVIEPGAIIHPSNSDYNNE